LVGHVAQDLSVLMRQELELAKAEVNEEITKAGKAAGMLGGAGFAGYMMLRFGSIAAWWGLANVMDQQGRRRLRGKSAGFRPAGRPGRPGPDGCPPRTAAVRAW
jgi:hypothetical protein